MSPIRLTVCYADKPYPLKNAPAMKRLDASVSVASPPVVWKCQHGGWAAASVASAMGGKVALVVNLTAPVVVIAANEASGVNCARWGEQDNKVSAMAAVATNASADATRAKVNRRPSFGR